MAWMFGAPDAVVFVSAATALLILFRHRSNWQRLRTGTERRMGVRA
jgi:glycerol-3-phosphate acyltransferase PlsY